ncbi:FAD-binding oxidoreductase [Paraburkholderia rhynchosiae]|uniref:Naphthalene 1,2-dioxygenase n=1 Tax=Paraburkholderia rhynchosiae TaxID=487049 RepID=A0A2N7WIG1_9BURK|nr:FAD-binding oxidoreductase [Paraburkholderia rhynchosiae]PMS29259.1 naphthalene 1,2-dioxygenase [Paraburkholderia rhynchosiae]CAB3708493.1 Naphthalene 1,2-dioxygenase/salicylate 5-hydroxylase systems, ferredoxin--NAD(P)(+), reductase component [Paraburkholderia rhynchosiae]
MKVSILPLQRALDARAGDNLLDLLRANQIPVSYSCMSGRCGTCRCRVVSGSVLTAGSGESNAPINMGESVLACQTTLVDDCAIEIPEVDEIVVHPAKILKTTVLSIEDMTHDIKRLRLKLPKAFEFSPGQYANLQFTPQHARPYSMAVTQNPDEIEFHIRVVPDGRVTSYVANELKVGDSVRVSGPLGTAYLRRKTTGPIVCIAGGTGLAPILAILRGIEQAGMDNDVHVYFGVRSKADIYGEPWLDELQRRLGRMRFHVVVASGKQVDDYRSGVVTQAVSDDWSDMKGWSAYVAGAPVMVDAASILLRQKGVQPERIYADAFHSSGV